MLFTAVNFLFLINNVLSDSDTMDDLACTTEMCVDAAKAYRRAISPDIDPCEDFYSHICYKWEKENPIPPDFGQWNQILSLKEKTDHKIVELLRKNSSCSFITTIKMKLFKFYTSCMFWQNDSYEKVFFDMIMKELGGFPLIGMSLQRYYNWEDSLARAISKFNLRNVLLSLDIEYDVTSPLDPIIVLSETTLTKQKGYFLSSEAKRGDFCSYKNEIKTFLRYFLSLFPRYRINYLNLDKMVAFEVKLAKIIDKHSKRKDPIKEGKTVVGEFQRSVPGLNITRFLKEVFWGINNINNDTELYVTRTEYFKDLQDIIKDTEDEVIADYIGWRFFTESIDALNFYSKDRNDYCSKYIAKYFPLELQYINLYDYHNGPKEIEEIQNMILELKAALVVHRMLHYPWLSHLTKREAITKMVLMKDGIYDPYDVLGNSEFLEYFKFLPEEDMFNTVLRTRAYMASLKLKTIHKIPSNRQFWLHLLDKFNTFYYQVSNTLYIPLHLTSFPFYGDELPPAVNFAGIGSAMAREMVHSFDEIGSDYKANGDYDNWWSYSTKITFDKKKQCYIQQYNSFKEAEINDEANLRENIADNEGLRAAYQAYENYVQRCDNCEKPLPGLKYTKKQLFFVAYAYSMCGKYRVDAESNYSYYKVYYSSQKYRVMSSLRNFSPFYETFNCNSSSTMRSGESCDLKSL